MVTMVAGTIVTRYIVWLCCAAVIGAGICAQTAPVNDPITISAANVNAAFLMILL
jgi:hypothetical protein